MWEYEEGACEILSDEEVIKRFESYSNEEIIHFITNTYGWNDAIYNPAGDTKFFNHSSEPDILTHDLKRWVAARDIYPGEEVNDNYASYQENNVLNSYASQHGVKSCTQFANYLINEFVKK